MTAAIFDFDGTLTDIHVQWDELTNTVNSVLEEFNIPPRSPEEYRHMRNLSSLALIWSLGIPLYRLPFVLPTLRRKITHALPPSCLYPDMDEVLRNLKADGLVVGILTSNNFDHVYEFLQRYELTGLLDFISVGSGLFGKHRHLKQIMRKHHLTPDTTFYIGDETRDIQAAEKVNLQSVSVTWGLNTKKVLESYNPDFIVETPKELMSAITNDSTKELF